MGIRLDAEIVDAQGLPVVTWVEDRNLFAPEGIGTARVCCFIRPDESGVLQFVSVGSVREGAFEEARPWELLKSFKTGGAEQLYGTHEERVRLETLASKSKSGLARGHLTDRAQVLMANFADEHMSVAMHLNCAEASMVEMARLHDRLHNEFIVKRAVLMRRVCGPDRKWPAKQPFVPHAPPAPAVRSYWAKRLENVAVAALVLGLLAWAGSIIALHY